MRVVIQQVTTNSSVDSSVTETSVYVNADMTLLRSICYCVFVVVVQRCP